jgi:hypothetical protein
MLYAGYLALQLQRAAPVHWIVHQTDSIKADFARSLPQLKIYRFRFLQKYLELLVYSLPTPSNHILFSSSQRSFTQRGIRREMKKAIRQRQAGNTEKGPLGRTLGPRHSCTALQLAECIQFKWRASFFFFGAGPKNFAEWNGSKFRYYLIISIQSWFN